MCSGGWWNGGNGFNIWRKVTLRGLDNLPPYPNFTSSCFGFKSKKKMDLLMLHLNRSWKEFLQMPPLIEKRTKDCKRLALLLKFLPISFSATVFTRFLQFIFFSHILLCACKCGVLTRGRILRTQETIWGWFFVDSGRVIKRLMMCYNSEKDTLDGEPLCSSMMWVTLTRRRGKRVSSLDNHQVFYSKFSLNSVTIILMTSIRHTVCWMGLLICHPAF